MPKITIDDREIVVEEGLNLIQAATRVGVEIPHFCYHPELSIVAQCRQCLVEVEGVPKVLPACNTFVRDGLVVRTNTEKAIKAREATVEFTLINHPLDCPICDKGGECPLQLTTFRHGPGHSRFGGPEEKKVRRKYYLSDKILYDPNRCIMCTRCVRFTEEVTKTGELGTSGRGFRKKIVVFPGKELDNDLAGNVIDLCPVGALLNKDNLHEERVWYWKFSDSVCSLCSNGCNITVGVDPRLGRVSRIRPRINSEVNGHWICDRGRYGFRDVQEYKRLRDPIYKNNGEYETTDWDNALDIFERRMSVVSFSDYNKTAFALSPMLTNEELFLLKNLSSAMKVDYMASHFRENTGRKKYGLISSDPYPNGTGVKHQDIPTNIDELIELILENRIDALFTASLDLFAIVDNARKADLVNALSSLSFLAVMDYRLTETARYADLILPGVTSYEKEGTFTNDQGRVQKLNRTIDPPGNAVEDWKILDLLGMRFNETDFGYENTETLFTDVSSYVPAYKGLIYDRIGLLGVNSHQ